MNKRAKKTLEKAEEALHALIVEFGLAMKSAERNYIANTGSMTLKMSDIWNRYREWCTEHRAYND